MKEDGIAGLELAMDTLILPLRPLHPLGIGSALGSIALSGGQKRNSLVLKCQIDRQSHLARSGSRWTHGPVGPSCESRTKLSDSRSP